jgi:hypothetical protein
MMRNFLVEKYSDRVGAGGRDIPRAGSKPTAFRNNSQRPGKIVDWWRMAMPPKNVKFDVHRFLANIGEGRTIVRLRKKQIIYTQGAKCDARSSTSRKAE